VSQHRGRNEKKNSFACILKGGSVIVTILTLERKLSIGTTPVRGVDYTVGCCCIKHNTMINKNTYRAGYAINKIG